MDKTLHAILNFHQLVSTQLRQNMSVAVHDAR